MTDDEQIGYFPRLGLSHGDDSLKFTRNEMIFKRGGKERHIPWSEMRSVTKSQDGATLHLANETVFIPNDYVWFEFVIEDMIEIASRVNPAFSRPVAPLEKRNLKVPKNHEEQLVYTRRAQRFYRERFPTYTEFEEFLQANLDWLFDESTYYACSMSMCTGSPVGEGYSTDLKIPPDAQWFRQFEEKAGSGCHKGSALLEILHTIAPDLAKYLRFYY
jgi:hypothetical protein